MAQTIYDAMKASRNPLAVAALKAIATSDELFSVLPFVGKDGEGFSYMREKSLGSFGFVADGHTSVPESTGEDELVIVPKREAVSDFYIRNFAQENLSSNGVSPRDRQTIKKFKTAGRTLANKFINGGYLTGFAINQFQNGAYIDAIVASSAHTESNRRGPGAIRYTNTGTKIAYRAPGDRDFGPDVVAAADGDYTLYSDNPSKWLRVTLDVSDASADAVREITFTSTTDEFDGLKKLISLSQVRSSSGANGDAPSLAILDQLLDAVKVRGDQLVYVMNASVRRKFENIFRSMGGASPLTLPNTNRQVPSYKGVPLLTNDWIGSDESKGSATTLSSIYCASLGEEGAYMGALGGETFDVQADPRNATVLGFRLFELGQIQGGPSAFGRRLSWFGSAALGSDLAAARASEITTL